MQPLQATNLKETEKQITAIKSEIIALTKQETIYEKEIVQIKNNLDQKKGEQKKSQENHLSAVKLKNKIEDKIRVYEQQIQALKDDTIQHQKDIEQISSDLPSKIKTKNKKQNYIPSLEAIIDNNNINISELQEKIKKQTSAMKEPEYYIMHFNIGQENGQKHLDDLEKQVKEYESIIQKIKNQKSLQEKEHIELLLKNFNLNKDDLLQHYELIAKDREELKHDFDIHLASLTNISAESAQDVGDKMSELLLKYENIKTKVNKINDEYNRLSDLHKSLNKKTLANKTAISIPTINIQTLNNEIQREYLDYKNVIVNKFYDKCADDFKQFEKQFNVHEKLFNEIHDDLFKSTGHEISVEVNRLAGELDNKFTDADLYQLNETIKNTSTQMSKIRNDYRTNRNFFYTIKKLIQDKKIFDTNSFYDQAHTYEQSLDEIDRKIEQIESSIVYLKASAEILTTHLNAMNNNIINKQNSEVQNSGINDNLQINKNFSVISTGPNKNKHSLGSNINQVPAKTRSVAKSALIFGTIGLGVGTGIGAIVGTIIGTFILPGIGTLAGGKIGAAIGAGIGAVFSAIGGAIYTNKKNKIHKNRQIKFVRASSNDREEHSCSTQQMLSNQTANKSSAEMRLSTKSILNKENKAKSILYKNNSKNHKNSNQQGKLSTSRRFK